jgi:mannan endo-1,4-beta-mannosidase
MTGKKALAHQFEQAASMGLNVVRAWAHTVDPMYKVMKSPGKYDESGLRAIDFMLNQARESGVRVILSLLDNWKYYGGVDEMVDFSESAPKRTSERPRDDNGDFSQATLNETMKEYEVRRHALFFTDDGSKDIYKNHVKTLLTRRNYYSGVMYKDDPTIFAWNLINEPRCESWVVEECEVSLQNWIREMAKYVKGLDSNHLLTVGSEGFFARSYNGSEVAADLMDQIDADVINPASWAAFTGQDFLANHMIDEIDFATVHLWPDNWNQTSKEFQTKWIESHLEAASETLQKPLIVQEFGKKKAKEDGLGLQEERDGVYQMVEGLVESSVQKRGELKGSLFWNWEIDLLVGAEADPYTLKVQDSTFGLIKTHAHAMHNISKSQIYSCDDFDIPPLY